MKIYKIRNKNTGLFVSTVWGNKFTFSRKGRFFNGWSFLKRHLESMKHRDYTECEIVEYELVESKTMDIIK